MLLSLLSATVLAGHVLGYDQVLGFDAVVEQETRNIDEIYEAALNEGGIVTLWHGGDEAGQQDALKAAFEERFPGMTLNITVALSKYHDVRLDQQLAAGGEAVYVDSIVLQTLHDYPRWAQQGALLHYAPNGFDQIDHAFKDAAAAWYGMYVFSWFGGWSTVKLPNIEPPVEWHDWLRPEFKDRLVITYPNDDDAVVFAFYLVMRQYGTGWFDALLEQNPRWVRGTQTPSTLVSQENNTYAALFPGYGSPRGVLNFTLPTQGKYVSWAQTGAILKDAPHPEGAKLLHNYILSTEYQSSTGMWSTRRDVSAPEGLGDLWTQNATNPVEFARFMADRSLVERLRFFFEDRIGVPVGLDPVFDGM